ncbi:HSP20 family protein [Klebsormidium nitens]|uniref:HSP20 family protein n=1 Tax=Klebsormidium nitens TaxID=105231 RepID=A0A1Y1HP20_KLENI|nr:HSP20 family protein [Klebsormidium nitens]|eukprot:GAQ79532.1 HSP20 family protein [Klebsormidium nitens]
MALSSFNRPFTLDPFFDLGSSGLTDPWGTWGGGGFGGGFGGFGDWYGSGARAPGFYRGDNTDPDQWARTMRERRAILNTDVDWVEYPDAHVFFIDMPGVPKENVKVQLEQDRTLVIRAERNTTPKGQDFTFHRAERGDFFMRRFRLPANADTSKIEAKFDNGVLEVKVPKKEEAVKHETKDVEVKHD